MRSFVVALALLAATAVAHAVTPLPARGDTSVYDTAAVLDASTRRDLEQLDRELWDKARVAMVIVTVPRLEGETIDQLAVRVQHDWGVGAKGSGGDESIVIALAVSDRKVFVATGYGSEGYLPDGKVGELRDRARPKLAANDYAGGIRELAKDLATVAATAHGVVLDDSVRGASAADHPAHGSGCDGGVSAIVIVLALLWLVGSRRGGGGGGGGLWPGLFLGSWLGGGGRDRFGGGGFGGGGDGGGGGFGGFGGGSGGGGGAGGSF